jgi:serine/threonine protein kinase
MYETKEERDALFGFTRKYTERDLLNKVATGFGWAVLVQDNLEDNQLKVVKLPNREDATRELLVEAKILTKIARYLRHPNLIALGSVERYVIKWNGKEEERYFVVLQYGGKDLRKRLGKLGIQRPEGRKEEYVYVGGQPLPVEEVLQLGIQVSDGLRALHEFEEAPGLHIVHRDIKPENILVDDQGVARLTDFGISKVVERLTQSVTVAGTLPYLAPEYSLGRITAASDIYSLGIVLYEMATGRFPFRFLDERFHQMPPLPSALNPAIPARLSEVILRAMWWDPSAGLRDGEALRYGRAADLLQDLRRCYARMYPVPRDYEPLAGAGSRAGLYRDRATNATVRISLYETKQPALCVSRLAAVARLDDPRVLSPRRVFESEEMVGVVTPPLPAALAAPSRTTAIDPADVTTVPEVPPTTTPAPPPRLEGRAIYDFLPQFLLLCEQIQKLHHFGIYHGWLCPQVVHWDGSGWIIDQVWLGPLAGAAASASVLARSEIPAGFLAPEILNWDALPTLSSDLYGLGAILYGRLTGTPPLGSEAALSMRDRAPTVSRRLQNILVRALQPDPARRYQSVDEMVSDVGACRWPDDLVATLVEDARDYQRQGRLVEAYDALDQAQHLAPGHEEVHHARAEIYFREGSYRWALKENAKALNVNPTPSVCFLHGQCLVALERYDEALDCYREGLARKDCSLGRHLLAQCLERAGKLADAVSECERALRIAETVEHDLTRIPAINADLEAFRSRVGK